ncbi:DUF4232 domain-containing protein [Streptomyces sp. NPDC051020]|uniref:DUF4232 domain-containing protein n=1 Tax=Streptomyces sp. NPDC051020 TaxID=3155409 RepID=UPI00343BFF92
MRSIRTTALAATALLAALSLTACSDNNGGDNGTAGAAAPAGSTVDQQSPAAAAPDSGKDAKDTDSTSDAPADNTAAHSKGSTSGTGGQKRNTGDKGTGNGSPVTCIGENTKVTVSKVSRPINHLLLTMTNRGSRACNAYHAPKLRFDDAQSVFRILDDSKPQAVVTLAPGQSAYAAIGLTGDTDLKNQHKATHLSVYFSAKDPSGSTDTAPAELTLPADTYVDDQGFVTYWQSDMADALTY